MNWWLLVGALVIGFIGGVMVHDGDNPLTRWLGLFITMAAGVLFSFGANIPESQGYIMPDKNQCVYYVFIEDVLTCVPYGEEG